MDKKGPEQLARQQTNKQQEDTMNMKALTQAQPWRNPPHLQRKTPKTLTPRPEKEKGEPTKKPEETSNKTDTNWHPVRKTEESLPQSDPDWLPQHLVRTFLGSLTEVRKGESKYLSIQEVTQLALGVGLIRLPDNGSLCD